MYPDSNVNFLTACSEEEAVVLLLSGIKGPIYPRRIEYPAYGITSEMISRSNQLRGLSLKELCGELRDIYAFDLQIKTEEEETNEEVIRAKNTLSNIDLFIKDVYRYLLDIDEELKKGSSSMLKIDQVKTDERGFKCITLRSLDDWAWSKYSIEILDGVERATQEEKNYEDTEAYDDIDGIQTGLSKTKAKNLYITLGFLVEAFSSIAPKFGKGNPNVSAIAAHIEKLATSSNHNAPISGQSKESIKDRIEMALKIKGSSLPIKK